MKFCDYCGRENEDAAIYCRECGTSAFKKRDAWVKDESQQSGALESPESELVASDTPTICEWCGRENATGAVNCHECGSSLERPKAKPEIRVEVPEPKPGRWQFRALSADEVKLDLVTLLTCRNIIEADVVVGQLESIGISAFIPDEFLAQTMAWNVNAFGYVRVQVSPKDYEGAKAFLLELPEITEPGAELNGSPAVPGESSRAGPPSES